MSAVAIMLGKTTSDSSVIVVECLGSHGSQKDVWGTSHSRRGAPDCRSARGQLYSGKLGNKITIHSRTYLQQWAQSCASAGCILKPHHEEHQQWHCLGWGTPLRACLHEICIHKRTILIGWHQCACLSGALNAAFSAHVTGEA